MKKTGRRGSSTQHTEEESVRRAKAAAFRVKSEPVGTWPEEPSAPEPDWEMWRLMGTVYLWQAAALLARLNPDRLRLRDSGEFEGSNPTFIRMLRIMRSNTAEMDFEALSLEGADRHRVKLGVACRWAEKKGLSVPEELVQLMERDSSTTAKRTDPAEEPYIDGLNNMCREFENAGGRRLGKDKPRALRDLLRNEGIKLESVSGLKRGPKRIRRDVLTRLASKYK